MYGDKSINKKAKLLTKTTAEKNEGAVSYHSVRGLYFQAVIFVATLDMKMCSKHLRN